MWIVEVPIIDNNYFICLRSSLIIIIIIITNYLFKVPLFPGHYTSKKGINPFLTFDIHHVMNGMYFLLLYVPVSHGDQAHTDVSACSPQ